MLKNKVISEYVNIDDLNEFSLLDITNYDPNKETLLLVDDAAAVTFLMYKLCKRAKLTDKYNIIIGNGYDVAMKIIKTLWKVPEFNIDYILTDITFSNNIVINERTYNFNGIDLVGLLYKLNPVLKYLFLTAHQIDHHIAPKLFETYTTFKKDDLMNYINYKDDKISTNMELVYRLVGHDDKV